MSGGSVTRDAKTGTWLFVVDAPSPDGRRRQLKRRGFATKRDATEALAQIVADQSRGTFVRPARVSLGDFLLNEWLPAKQASLRPSTAASYSQAINNYVMPRIGAAQLPEVDGAMLNELYGALLSHGRQHESSSPNAGLSPKTVRNVHGLLNRAFRDAIRWGRLARNPCEAADPPRASSPEMPAWSTDEIRSFLSATSEHRWAAIWQLLATTGMRRGEILGLKWSDLDLEGRTVSIRTTRVRFGKTITSSEPKTARSIRTISIGPSIERALRKLRVEQSKDRLLMGEAWDDSTDLVVVLPDGSAPNPESFSNLFIKLTQRAGLRRIRLHDLRHSYATAALASGIGVKVVSERLGHADVGVTLKTYAHVMPGDDNAAAIVADRLVEG